jgi:hypothetical protein
MRTTTGNICISINRDCGCVAAQNATPAPFPALVTWALETLQLRRQREQEIAGFKGMQTKQSLVTQQACSVLGGN